MPRGTQALPAWAGEELDRHAIAPWLHGIPGRRFGWQRCAAVPGKSSTPPDRGSAQPLEWSSPGLAEERSPPARERRDNGRRSASLKAQISMAVCHLPLETILSLPPAMSRPRSPHPHSPCLPRSLPRTLAAHLGLRSAVGPATTTAAVQIDPSVAFECTSQSPGKGCCDERLNPPAAMRSRHILGVTSQESATV